MLPIKYENFTGMNGSNRFNQLDWTNLQTDKHLIAEDIFFALIFLYSYHRRHLSLMILFFTGPIVAWLAVQQEGLLNLAQQSLEHAHAHLHK